MNGSMQFITSLKQAFIQVKYVILTKILLVYLLVGLQIRRNFQGQICLLFFKQLPSTYFTDRLRVTFILGLLTSKAAQWASAIWQNSYPLLAAEMKKKF
uniref:DUF4939 domain-containing protein n=1 Tax=Mola mola TaxID=94237 RepID=A0A3Q4AKT3_MOLML